MLATLKFKQVPTEEILAKVPYLKIIADQSGISKIPDVRARWIMGQLLPTALGNIPMADLKQHVDQVIARKAAIK